MSKKINETILTFFSLLMLTSCGQIKEIKDLIEHADDRPNLISDSRFDSYKSKFEEIIRNESGDNSFTVGDIPIVTINNLSDNSDKEVAGLCHSYSDGKKFIEISRSFWENANKWSRQIIINHELGHCRLNRKHSDLTYRGHPLSIMNSTIIGAFYYREHESSYNQELFLKDSSFFIAELDQLN